MIPQQTVFYDSLKNVLVSVPPPDVTGAGINSAESLTSVVVLAVVSLGTQVVLKLVDAHVKKITRDATDKTE